MLVLRMPMAYAPPTKAHPIVERGLALAPTSSRPRHVRGYGKPGLLCSASGARAQRPILRGLLHHKSNPRLEPTTLVSIRPVQAQQDMHTAVCPILAEDGDHDNSDDDDHPTEQQPSQQEAPPDPVLTEDEEEQRPCEHCTACGDNMTSAAAT